MPSYKVPPLGPHDVLGSQALTVMLPLSVFPMVQDPCATQSVTKDRMGEERKSDNPFHPPGDPANGQTEESGKYRALTAHRPQGRKGLQRAPCRPRLLPCWPHTHLCNWHLWPLCKEHWTQRKTQRTQGTPAILESELPTHMVLSGSCEASAGGG
jgi:hypothetical protein